ncbi:MAG: serine phosphatase RsbU (regulator of sigma subunit) [Bacteroidia bacterium]
MVEKTKLLIGELYKSYQEYLKTIDSQSIRTQRMALVSILFVVIMSLATWFQSGSWYTMVQRHNSDLAFIITDFALLIMISYAIWSFSHFAKTRNNRLTKIHKVLAEELPVELAVFTEDHRYVYCNKALESDSSARLNMVGKDDFEILLSQGKELDTALIRRKNFLKCVSLGEPIEWLESSGHIEDSSSTHRLNHYELIRGGSEGKNLVIGYGIDVTDFVKMNQKGNDLAANLRYAKNIQKAILPDKDSLGDAVGEAGVIYLPKDILSGDFFWKRQKYGRVFYALADCTGHGISGALLTVLFNQTLNQCIDEFGLLEPAQILDKCRELVMDILNKGTNQVTDGMDVSLCCFYEGKISFSGANRPIWLMRGDEIKELNGSRFPIGTHIETQQPFEQIELVLRSQDRIYMFSDGVTDQFGQETQKKFTKNRLRATLQKIANSNTTNRLLEIERVFKEWQGTLEQLDDVTIMEICYLPSLIKKQRSNFMDEAKQAGKQLKELSKDEFLT